MIRLLGSVAAPFVVAAVCILVAPAVRAADKVVASPTATSPEAPIAQAFRAAIAGDFQAYLEAVHPEHRGSPEERDQRQNYEWTRFLSQFQWYLKSTDPVKFVVVNHKADGERIVRVFLRDQIHPDRMPVPVKLKRDGTQWKIVVSSL